jgi:hypothetical protein
VLLILSSHEVPATMHHILLAKFRQTLPSREDDFSVDKGRTPR